MNAILNTSGRRQAFSLMEVMLATTLMAVIVFTLIVMFNMVQKTFLASNEDNTVFDGGKAVVESLAGDLQQMDAAEDGSVHFMIRYSPFFDPPLIQSFFNDAKTNLVQDFYTIRNLGNQWYGTVYRVIPTPYLNDPSTGPSGWVMGTIYRFSTNSTSSRIVAETCEQYLRATTYTNFNAIAEGALNLTVTPIDSKGRIINQPPYYDDKRYEWHFFKDPNSETNTYLPAYIEVELTLLESKSAFIVDRFPTRQAAYNYLTNRADKTHIFRRRVPIQTAPRPKP